MDIKNNERLNYLIQDLLTTALISAGFNKELIPDITDKDFNRIKSFTLNLTKELKSKFPRFKGLENIIKEYIGITGSTLYSFVDDAYGDESFKPEDYTIEDAYIWELVDMWCERCSIEYISSLTDESMKEWNSISSFIDDYANNQSNIEEDTPYFNHYIGSMWNSDI